MQDEKIHDIDHDAPAHVGKQQEPREQEGKTSPAIMIDFSHLQVPVAPNNANKNGNDAACTDGQTDQFGSDGGDCNPLVINISDIIPPSPPSSHDKKCSTAPEENARRKKDEDIIRENDRLILEADEDYGFSDMTDEDVDEIMANLSRMFQASWISEDLTKRKCSLFTGNIGTKHLRKATADKVAKVMNAKLSRNGADCLVAAVSPAVWPLFLSMLQTADEHPWFDISGLPESIAGENLIVCRFLDGIRCQLDAYEMAPSSVSEICGNYGIDANLFLGHSNKTLLQGIKSQNSVLIATRALSFLLFAAMLVTTAIVVASGHFITILFAIIALFLHRRNPFVFIVSGDEGTSIGRIFKVMKIMREQENAYSPQEVAKVAYKTASIRAENISNIAYILLVFVILTWNVLVLALGIAPLGAFMPQDALVGSVWG